MEKINQNQLTPNDEIDLLQLVKTIWTSRRLVLYIILAFTAGGVFVSLLLNKEFTAGSTFVPQTSEPGKMGGSLGGLASLAGINLGGMGAGSEIPPSLYPKIVSSVTFQKELLKAKINPLGNGEAVTYQFFYDSIYNPGLLSQVGKYTLGLPGVIINKLKGTSIPGSNQDQFDLVNISQSEFNHFKKISSQITIQHNQKEGFVSLSFSMPEPLMAAQMAKYAEELLQKEVIEYKIQNAREQLIFTEERFEEKKIEFEKIQKKLANFRDRNQNLSSAMVLNELEKLEAEYNFSFNVYSELAKQLEQSKLQVSQNTPVFSVIQPVSIPIEKSAPKRPLIVLVFSILGMIVSFGFVFGKEYFHWLKESWPTK